MFFTMVEENADVESRHSNYFLNSRLNVKNSKVSPSHIPRAFYLAQALESSYLNVEEVKEGRVIEGRFGDSRPA